MGGHYDSHRRGLDDDRLGVDHRGRLRHRADVNPAIEAGVANGDGDADVGSSGGADREHRSE